MTADRTGADVLREVVHALAPDELPHLDEARRAYAEQPYAPGRPGRSGGGVLTAGVDTAVLLPVLVAFVAQFLADVTAGAVRRGGSALARRRARRRRSGDATEERRAALVDPVPDAAPFPRDDLLRWAVDQARDCGLSRGDADRYGCVLVVALVGPTPAPSGALDVGSGSGPGDTDPGSPPRSNTGPAAPTGSRPDPDPSPDPGLPPGDRRPNARPGTGADPDPAAGPRAATDAP
ncbi:hypothetical protein [Streptomyces sp. NPDC048057]|uniref:hypothetical protein n=1 Tax=Streptomyces sp. NPDC048057 TaxID=3155628 RepID=UPI0033F99122